MHSSLRRAFAPNHSSPWLFVNIDQTNCQKCEPNLGIFHSVQPMHSSQSIHVKAIKKGRNHGPNGWKMSSVTNAEHYSQCAEVKVI